ncbi:hypothetical protein GOP47_0015082 [Adiantum capillus-veneris]|uniref:VQ domain-containing protein n=1 Tax=Adiantum capillus-veneris TaxID=13818 RepID=A0A9D4UN97_ADICA|nr:hypothetical protein GOP47_0015082 [Adiantum capillus-veneris]
MAPRKAIDPSSADSSSQTSVTHGEHLPQMARSSHSIKKRQPIVRIVQVRPPKIINADLASFRDIVHHFTGHQVATCEQKEAGCTTETKKQKTENVSISKSSRATASLAPSPSTSSSPPSSSLSSSSSSFSDAESLHTKSQGSKSNEMRIARCSNFEQDFQEYGSLLASWDCITNGDTTSKFMNGEDLIASISNDMEGSIYSGFDSVTPFDHMNMIEFNKMNLNYYS